MSHRRRRFAMFYALTALGALGPGCSQSTPAAEPKDAPPVAAKGEPVLVELFTSQGCSSCPPADALAEKLAADRGLVVIARPVTYWDRLGWKDTLAREENTTLQRDYARRGLAGQNGVYTPQMVVDGAYGAVGSRAADVASGVKRYGAKSDATIRIAPAEAGGYSVNLEGTAAGKAELVLIAVTRKVAVAIGTGENGGRRVTYTNVVRAERKLGEWSGGKGGIALAASQLKVAGADRYAIVLRQPGGGKVLAARWIG